MRRPHIRRRTGSLAYFLSHDAYDVHDLAIGAVKFQGRVRFFDSALSSCLPGYHRSIDTRAPASLYQSSYQATFRPGRAFVQLLSNDFRQEFCIKQIDKRLANPYAYRTCLFENY